MRAKSLVIAMAALALCAEARAESIVVTLPVVTTDGITDTYSYGATLTFHNSVQPGDYLTIVDFQGFVSATAPAGWVVSTSATGGIPAGQQTAVNTFPLNDAANLPNVTFTYLGSTPLNSFPGDTFLGLFNLKTSVLVGSNVDSYVAQDTTSSGTKSSNIGQTFVPFSANGPFITPLPAAGWAGMALFGLIAGNQLRRRHAL